MTTTVDERTQFENVIKSIEVQLANSGTHLTMDSAARMTYASEVRSMAERLRRDATSGKITWANAALQAQETRNLVMETVRGQSTPIGRALAQRLKAEGYSLNQLIARQTKRMYGEKAVFARLSLAQRNSIYAGIVSSAGKANPTVNAAMARVSYAGKGLLVVSVGLSLYNVATAKDKMSATRREVVTTSAGIGGGIAGGALAGVACGPGAPVCVTVGAFVGGALAAFGVSYL